MNTTVMKESTLEPTSIGSSDVLFSSTYSKLLTLSKERIHTVAILGEYRSSKPTPTDPRNREFWTVFFELFILNYHQAKILFFTGTMINKE